MADAQTTASPNPIAVPSAQNQSQPIPPAAPGAMPVYNEVMKQYDQVATQGLTGQTKQQIGTYQPIQEPFFQGQPAPTPTKSLPTATPTETQAAAMSEPGTLVTGQKVGEQQTGTGMTPVTTQAMTTTDASRREAGIQEVMRLNQIGYEDAAKRYDTATGKVSLSSVQAKSVLNSELSGNISSGLYGDDSGVLSTDNYNASRSMLGGVIGQAESTTLNSILAESDAQAKALIQSNIDEYNRMVSFAQGTTVDPVMAQLIQRQGRIAQQMTSAITDIHAQAEVSLTQQEKANKEMMGKAKAAVNAAGQVGSMVGEGYLASQMQNNLDALQSIKASEQKAINDARMYFENMQDDLAFKQVELVEKRRQQANDLLTQNFQIGKDMESMKMQRVQFQAQLQNEYRQQVRENKADAVQFIEMKAKAGISAEAIPKEAWTDWASEQGPGVTPEFMKTMYAGAMKDLHAKDVETFNKNTAEFYKAASQIKDPNMVMYRPNMDGTFTSVKRSEIQTVPNYDTFQTTKGGKNYAVYVNKEDPTAKPVEVPIGDADAKTTYQEDAVGNTIAFIDRGDGNIEAKKILDFNGNPMGHQAILDTQRAIDSSGFSSTGYSDGTHPGSLGSLSSRFESNGDPGAIGYDKTGGTSYGAYQLAHDNALKFVESSPYAGAFHGIAFNTPAFKNKWKQIAAQDPAGFEEAQKQYIEKTHYGPQVNMLAKFGIDVDSFTQVTQDVIWSTAVQMGGNTSVVKNAIKNVGVDASEEQIIKEIYKERWDGGANFASSTKQVRDSVKNRFFGKGGEQELALKQLRAQQTAVPRDNGMAWSVDAPSNAPIITHVKNGIVKNVEQIGQGKDGSPIMSVSILDKDTNTIQKYNGLAFSSLREGMSWDSTKESPNIGNSGTNGHSQAVYNADGSPVKPTGEIDTQKYGTWGQYATIPPKVAPQLKEIENDIQAGKLDMDGAVEAVLSTPGLNQVRSDVILNRLAPQAKISAQKLQQANAYKDLQSQNLQEGIKQKQLREARTVVPASVVAADPRIKTYRQVQALMPGIRTVETNLSQNNWIGDAPTDIGLLDKYVRMETGNAVTEAQVNAVKEHQSILDSWRNAFTKGQKGGFLTPQSRQKIVKLAHSLEDESKSTFDSAMQEYQSQLDQNGINFQLTPQTVNSYTASYVDSSGQSIPIDQSFDVGSIPMGGMITDPEYGDVQIVN